FRELARHLTPQLDNRVVRVIARGQWLAEFRPDDAREFYRPDAVLDDRRTGINAGEVVGAANVQHAIEVGTEGFGGLRLEPLAVRGDARALYRWAYQQDGGFEAPGITVIEMVDDLVQRVTSFDESDLDAALELLEARYAEIAGDAYLQVERNVAEAIALL